MGRCLPVWPGASCKLARMLPLLLQAQDLVAEVFMCTLTQLRPSLSGRMTVRSSIFL